MNKILIAVLLLTASTLKGQSKKTTLLSNVNYPSQNSTENYSKSIGLAKALNRENFIFCQIKNGKQSALSDGSLVEIDWMRNLIEIRGIQKSFTPSVLILSTMTQKIEIEGHAELTAVTIKYDKTGFIESMFFE